ncbi:MarR family transcriptional regulator [Vibrio mimicus]|nr:MarR family transcriptional regulator [Vibrio mimicus]QXC55446.1 MarR family transcriptional regulator [Vibrio mimicus]
MDSVERMVREWGSQKPELNTLPMSIIDRLLRITKRIELAMAEFYQQIGLTQGEFEVLMVLRRAGSPYCLTPTDLQIITLLSSGAMTHRLSKLETKGLVTRSMSKYDRRSVEVTLTDKGLNRTESLLPEFVALHERVLRHFSEEEQDTLTNQLQQWLSHYEQLWLIPELFNDNRQR